MLGEFITRVLFLDMDFQLLNALKQWRRTRLPIYDELKLALLIYLWYPKTKGTGYVYDTLLRPFMARHETEMERKVEEWRARAWDFALYYWQNCTDLGQTKWVEMWQILSGQSSRLKQQGKLTKLEDLQLDFDDDKRSRRKIAGGKNHKSRT
ncbi:hypothetical protein CXB51_029630 [Gossypium anomalum]|uniref:HVA22-like protein n=1 Tax=Gossypium anomalum TaxID=47600 RepID=A0A8J5Z1E7_9ROSI|nr:hypothetical protein CXB51_029630 [Gossypium anomalum]